MKIPLVDLQAQYRDLKREIDGAVNAVLGGGQYILGAEVESFEAEMAAYLGAGHAVGVASGTDALHIALLACGISAGDEVITTPFTFIATTEAIAKCGARPVFADIDPKTLNIDPAQIEAKISPRTKAVIPVHLFGQTADMAPVMELARRHGIMVVEDNAQALGADYRGEKAGSLGDAGALSFFPSKMLGAYGDGGMVLTSRAEAAGKARMLRNHGTREKYYNVIPGFNSRLDALQAAVLRVKLRYLEQWIERRRQKAALYAGMLAGIGGIEAPYEAGYGRHVFNYYTIRVREGRGELQRRLGAAEIATAVYYPFSLHLQEVYGELGYRKGDFPESERAQEEVLSLPIYPELSDGQIEEIARVIRGFATGG